MALRQPYLKIKGRCTNLGKMLWNNPYVCKIASPRDADNGPPLWRQARFGEKVKFKLIFGSFVLKITFAEN
jgi:hypothetical protein